MKHLFEEGVAVLFDKVSRVSVCNILSLSAVHVVGIAVVVINDRGARRR